MPLPPELPASKVCCLLRCVHSLTAVLACVLSCACAQCLPASSSPPRRGQVVVELTPTFLAISVDEKPVLGGALYREIKRDESTWYIQVGAGPRGGGRGGVLGWATGAKNLQHAGTSPHAVRCSPDEQH